jgi:hypothetical protein
LPILEVDQSQDAAICSYCKTPFIIEKAVNIYNITNVNGAADSDFVIEAGRLKAYHGASTDVVIPDTVHEIGEGCFEGMGVTSVVIPDSVTNIGESAFEDCTGLTGVTIPSGLECIEKSTFSGCSNLTTIISNARHGCIVCGDEISMFGKCRSCGRVYF